MCLQSRPHLQPEPVGISPCLLWVKWTWPWVWGIARHTLISCLLRHLSLRYFICSTLHPPTHQHKRVFVLRSCLEQWDGERDKS